jgi:hypothetical protein
VRKFAVFWNQDVTKYRCISIDGTDTISQVTVSNIDFNVRDPYIDCNNARFKVIGREQRSGATLALTGDRLEAAITGVNFDALPTSLSRVTSGTFIVVDLLRAADVEPERCTDEVINWRANLSIHHAVQKTDGTYDISPARVYAGGEFQEKSVLIPVRCRALGESAGAAAIGIVVDKFDLLRTSGKPGELIAFDWTVTSTNERIGNVELEILEKNGNPAAIVGGGSVQPQVIATFAGADQRFAASGHFELQIHNLNARKYDLRLKVNGKSIDRKVEFEVISD